MLAESKEKTVNSCRFIVKERTGVHSSLVVILLKIDDMLGEQITAGQLTNIEKAYMHILIILTPMRFDWALQHYT